MAPLLDQKLVNSSLHLPQLHAFYDEFNRESMRILILPTLHNQPHFSSFATQLLQEDNFDRILVELPEELEDQLVKIIDRLPVPTVMYSQIHQEGDQTLIPEAGKAYIIHPGESLYWSCYLGRRQGIPVTFIDSWHAEAYQSWQIPLGYEHLAAIGWTSFWEEESDIVDNHLDHQVHRTRTQLMMKRLATAISEDQEETMLIVCGAAHWPGLVVQLQELGFESTTNLVPQATCDRYQNLLEDVLEWKAPRMPRWKLADIHPHTLHLVTGSLPYYLGKLVEDPTAFDLLECIRQLYFDAEILYQQKFDDQISPASYRRLFQYLRNLGRIQGQVLPDLYNLIAGAKGMVDDDYAFEVYRTAISYPFLPSDTEKLDKELKFVPDEQQGEVIRFAFKRRIKRPVLKKVDQDEFDDLDPIPDEDYPGQWQEIWDKYSPYGYVSYPPEDDFSQQYMGHIRKKIIEILMEEESATMEFETSLEDGIDWRETMRHYDEGKIYVKKYPKNKYQVGALVIQFLEEPLDEEYSHHSTLFAEHDQESHISVITTEPGEVLVGPGISRVKYAALISQFPPVGMAYLISQQNVDLKLRLIWTAMQMSLNRIIGFVAKRPPTAAQRHFAAEQGYRLVYLPMGQLTSQSLRRLRTMHLLAHRDLRDRAREYIGF